MARPDVTARERMRDWGLQYPSFDLLDPSDFRVVYDPTSDTVRVSLVGDQVPAISFVVDDYYALRVEPESGRVVGFEAERFCSRSSIGTRRRTA